MILHFFFWNLGTNLQKSHTGLLRALLHAALEQHPELIPAVFPKIYRNYGNSDNDEDIESDDINDPEPEHIDDDETEHPEVPEPEFIEIKKAFELLIEKSGYLRLVVFIDGDHREIAIFLRSLASHHVKLTISSRPLNTCLHSLAGCPTLRLHDLTRRDMTAYVHGELSTHHLMIRLVEFFPTEAPQLASGIVDKAEGVFLWVRLVVRMLIKGLEDGDSLEELQATLSALPSDLRYLYKIKFAKMSIEYQKKSAVMFQLNETWFSVSLDENFPGLLMWYAINNPGATLKQLVGQMLRDQYDWGMSSPIKRLQSRCCGLLEVRYAGRTLDGLSKIPIVRGEVSIEDIGKLTIAYLHRTVHEFIIMEELWHEICALTSDACFSIPTRLASACLSAIKLASSWIGRHVRFIKIITQLCREVADTTPGTAHAYLMNLERTISTIGSPALELPKEPHTNDIISRDHWSSRMFEQKGSLLAKGVLSHASIYTYAAGRGLLCHPMPFPSNIDQRHRFEIVFHALMGWTRLQKQVVQVEDSVPPLKDRI